MNIPEVLLPFLYPPVLCLLHQTCVRLQISGNVRGTWAWRHAIKMQAAISASGFLPRNNFSSSDSLYDCFAMSLMVLDRECWLHQLEMSRNACIKLRSERGALQFSSYTRTTVAKADDSIQLLHAIHKGIHRGTDTRWVITFIVYDSCLTEAEPFIMCKMQSSHLHAIHSEYLQYGHPYQPTTPTNEDTTAEFLNDLARKQDVFLH